MLFAAKDEKFHDINMINEYKNTFYFLESESFHNDDTYDTLNEPKHESVTEVTFLSLKGNNNNKTNQI